VWGVCDGQQHQEEGALQRMWGKMAGECMLARNCREGGVGRVHLPSKAHAPGAPGACYPPTAPSRWMTFLTSGALLRAHCQLL
jgi:hypothetical protein